MLGQSFADYRPWLDFGCAVASGLLELAFTLAVQGSAARLGITLLAAGGLLATPAS